MSKIAVVLRWNFVVDGKEEDATIKAFVWDDGTVDVLSAVWDGADKTVSDDLIEAAFDEIIKEAYEKAAENIKGLEDAHWNSKLLALKEGER